MAGQRKAAARRLLGFTGTNAHVLIEERRRKRRRREDRHGRRGGAGSDTPEQPVNVLALSARSPEALVALAQL